MTTNAGRVFFALCGAEYGCTRREVRLIGCAVDWIHVTASVALPKTWLDRQCATRGQSRQCPRADHSSRCQPRSQGRDIKCLTPSNRPSAQHGRDPGAGKTADSRGDTSWYLKGPRSLFPPVDFLVQGYRIVNKRARTGPAAAAAIERAAAAPPRGKRQRRGRQQRTHAPSGPSSSS